MSIRKKSEQAVHLLLAQLDTLKEGIKDDANLCCKFTNFRKELEGMMGAFPDTKTWEKEMMDRFCALEKDLKEMMDREKDLDDDIIMVEDKLGLMTTGISELKELFPTAGKGIPTKPSKSDSPRGGDHQTVCQEWVDLGVDHELLEMRVKSCSLCLSLSVFPMNSIIEKRPLIYWWIGEGLVKETDDKTAEEVGEQVFQELLDEGFIRPSSENRSLSVNSFVIHPQIHKIAKEDFEIRSYTKGEFLGQEKDAQHGIRNNSVSKEGEDVITVFNVNEEYLKKTPEWLSKLRKVKVLQMGRWQSSVFHHIEVVDPKLFSTLGSQKDLKYLSLRGISRVETLPNSISKLVSLQILDLRACHNLEKLPPTISKLKNLTHLDVSQCYLLESIPKGLEELTSLQVVKGFVIGKAKKTSCKISDLSQLKKLRKLSIRVSNGGEKQQELSSLANLSALSILTISWGDQASFSEEDSVSLPANLTKLDLRCVPFEAVPTWLMRDNSQPKLAKLYIIGGKLKTLEPEIIEDLNVEFLRLRCLKDLKIDTEEWVEHGYFDKQRL